MQNSKEKTLSQRIAERIIKYILEENLQPGDKLPNETVMCERLNVGRSSLREAMRALASRNVITIRQGSGSYVSATPGMIDDPFGLTFVEDKQKMIKDLMEIRFLIEPSIAAMAAIRADETDINKLDLKKEWIYISLDLNSLKHINDTYGHDVGDEMICAAAACMTASFGEFGKVYRIGGDEFVVIVTQKPDELDTMTKHFDSSVAEWRGKIVNSMTISYGCVRSLEEDWELVHDIEKEADRRMYASKARYYSDSGIDRRK